MFLHTINPSITAFEIVFEKVRKANIIKKENILKINFIFFSIFIIPPSKIYICICL